MCVVVVLLFGMCCCLLVSGVCGCFVEFVVVRCLLFVVRWFVVAHVFLRCR